MDYKELYTKALERARELQKKSNGMILKKWLWAVFPELKESEDEKMRKMCIEYLDRGYRHCSFADDMKNIEKCIAWLEKQGEQPHAELGQSEVTKISDQEPKFHEGDWIISNDKMSTYQVIEVKRGVYVIRDNADNYEYHIDIEGCEKSGRLWTIQDAKNGDLLVAGEMVFIFNKIHGEWVNCHCSLHSDNSLCTEDYDLLTTKYAQEIFPATKEQRELLFAKMRESGYEWDAQRKELKKIEHKTLNADEVIEWLNHRELMSNEFINRFKKYFGL